MSTLRATPKPSRRPGRKMGGLRNMRRGVASLEFALVLPIILLVLLAVVQFSTYLLGTQAIQAAAAVGAREATLPGATSPVVQQAVERSLNSWRFAAYVDPVVIEPTGWENLPTGSSVSVTVSVDADKAALNALRGTPGFDLTGKKVTARYVMRKE